MPQLPLIALQKLPATHKPAPWITTGETVPSASVPVMVWNTLEEDWLVCNGDYPCPSGASGLHAVPVSYPDPRPLAPSDICSPPSESSELEDPVYQLAIRLIDDRHFETREARIQRLYTELKATAKKVLAEVDLGL